MEKAEGILRRLRKTVEGIDGSESNVMDLAHLLASPNWAAYVESVKGETVPCVLLTGATLTFTRDNS